MEKHDSPYTKMISAGAIAGLLGGGAVALYFYLKDETQRDEEDRPKIIVRNGSLEFETDYDWEEKQSGRWRVKHDRGKWVSFYEVTFTGGSGACATRYAPEATIYFKDKVGVETAFTVSREPHNANKYEPVIIGPSLDHESSSSRKKIIYRAPGTIARVEVKTGPSPEVCIAPTSVTFQPLR